MQETATKYEELFSEFEKKINGGSGTPLHTLRKNAFGHFLKTGFPKIKDEEWRFTDIRPIVQKQFLPWYDLPDSITDKTEIAKYLFDDCPSKRFIFVNGRYRKELSSATGASGYLAEDLASPRIGQYAEINKYLTRVADSDLDPFNFLNTGFLHDGLFIKINENITVDGPLHIIYISTRDSAPFFTQPRNLIVSSRGSKANIIEHYLNLDGAVYLTNAVTEIIIEEGAHLEHLRIEMESQKGYHIGSTHVLQSEGSAFKQISFTTGGAIARNNIISRLNAQNSECRFFGLSLGTGGQVIDNHTTIDHASPNCNSIELYKSILDGSARGVFNGKILVRKDAQKTDSKQTNKTLILSDNATMNAKPQLEIFADDVKCTHGATMGYLDSDSIFYLRTRGIGEIEARDILTHAFANDIISHISVEPVRNYLNKQVDNFFVQRP